MSVCLFYLNCNRKEKHIHIETDFWIEFEKFEMDVCWIKLFMCVCTSSFVAVVFFFFFFGWGLVWKKNCHVIYLFFFLSSSFAISDDTIIHKTRRRHHYHNNHHDCRWCIMELLQLKSSNFEAMNKQNIWRL